MIELMLDRLGGIVVVENVANEARSESRTAKICTG